MSSRADKKRKDWLATKADAYLRLCEETVSPLMLEPWTPFERGHISQAPEVECWVNSRYQVNVKRYETPLGETIWLSIKLRDKTAGHDWRDFQRIKNELAGPECEAVELYPTESRLVDGANQYHLWCFPAIRFPFGFDQRLVTEQPETTDGVKYSRQRPFEQEPSSRQVVVHLDGDYRNNDPSNVRIVDQGHRVIPAKHQGRSLTHQKIGRKPQS